MPRRSGQSDAVAASVRMYKGILGDCFLLKFESDGDRTTVLIDCGIIQGVAGAKERIGTIAADIVRECGGDIEAGRQGVLDLLVVTHEHWDHISGFGQAADVFFGNEELGEAPKLRIAQLWMGWTEDPEHKLAGQLRERFGKRKKAVAKLGSTKPGDGHPFAAAPGEAWTGLEAFVGPIEDEGALGFGSRYTGRAIMEKLQEVAEKTKYLRPGDVERVPGNPSVRAYVLGPPEDTDLLFKDSPSSGEAKETYFVDRDVCEGPLVALAEDAAADLSGHSPFAPRHRRFTRKIIDGRRTSGNRPGDALDQLVDWFDRHYLADGACRFAGNAPRGHDCARDVFCRLDLARRRIDNDWMHAAGALALKLDNDTNNTSLVLAFELPGGDVLLFAADAQVGNWLSWHKQNYLADGREVTAEELLGRTILYKVGHHGSHNATLKDQGLGMMKDPRLAAMIPVVEPIARKQPGQGWKMPFPELKEELLARTSGRILRGDCATGTDLEYDEAEAMFEVRELDADPGFLARVAEGPSGADEMLWVEYRVTG